MEMAVNADLKFPEIRLEDDTKSLLCVKRDGNVFGYKTDILKEEIPYFLKSLVICSKCEGLARDGCGIGSPQLFVCQVCTEGNPYTVMGTIRETVSNLVIICPLKSRGCDWEGSISSAETHLVICDHFFEKCHSFCGTIFKRIDMEAHHNLECINRNVECEFCEENMRACDLILHQDVCIKFPLKCSNWCGETTERMNMQSHMEDICPNTVLQCDYHKYGCSEMVERKHRDSHYSDNKVTHIEMEMRSNIDKLTGKLDAVEQENISLNQKLTESNSEIQTLLEVFNEFMSKADIKFASLELQHDQLKETINLAGLRVDTLKRTSSFIEARLHGKVDNTGLHKVNLHCQQLENLVQYENKNDFFIKAINEELTSGLLGECKVGTLNCTYMVIHYKKIEVRGFVKLTGIFTVRRPLNVAIRFCFVLKNQHQDSIASLHNANININLPQHTVPEPFKNEVFAQGIRRAQSVLLSKENYTAALIDIPLTNMKADGVLANGRVMLQVYYTVQNNP